MASDRRLDSALTVRVGLIGDTVGVRLDPADGRVVLGSGKNSGKITVSLKDEAQSPAKIRMLLATSDGYDAAGSGTLDLTIEPVPPVVVKPTIAWESFAYDDQRALLLAEGSHGWAGKWGPSALEVVGSPLPVPADFSGAPPPSRHAAAISHDNKASFSVRPLTQRIGSGTVWVSCLMQGQKRSDNETDWCALGFEDHGKGGFSIAPQCTKNRTQWHINVPQPEDKGQPRYQLSRTADISIPVRMVVRLELGASTADIAYWINPTPGHEPQVNAADQLSGLPALGFDRVSVYASKSAALHLADLRIGRTWQEVMPGR